MELHLTPEQEAHLLQIATHEGKTPEQVVFDAALDKFEGDATSKSFARLKQTDCGEFIEEEEMNARFQKMMQS